MKRYTMNTKYQREFCKALPGPSFKELRGRCYQCNTVDEVVKVIQEAPIQGLRKATVFTLLSRLPQNLKE